MQGRAAGALLRVSVKEGPAQSTGMTNDLPSLKKQLRRGEPMARAQAGLRELGAGGFCPRSVGSAGRSLTINKVQSPRSKSQGVGCLRQRQGLEPVLVGAPLRARRRRAEGCPPYRDRFLGRHHGGASQAPKLEGVTGTFWHTCGGADEPSGRFKRAGQIRVN